ncbi:MAG: methylmalonyl-CoA epimerase [Bacteroidota bacterium]|nr:methylmalonyl-CoA epimerase [Bacteroidota bacterium]
MLNKIEHIGIAIKDALVSEPIFNALLNQKPTKREVVEKENVQTIFYQVGESKIELLQSLSDEGAIAKFIAKKGEGIHHIAFLVDDIVAELARLKSEGFQLINESPVPGADNKLIAFVHPKTTNGVLIELCQEVIKN